MKKSKLKITGAEALLRLQKLCSSSEKSEYEVRKKLAGWGLEKENTRIIERLKEENFLNSARFAQAFTHDKLTINKWGKMKVRYQLRNHQIPDDIIEKVLSAVDDNFYIEMVASELKKKSESINESNIYKLKAKLYAFGNQRGYESNLINDFLANEK